jgi:dihydrofolate synthase/folylpolyglutamate synthase
MALTRKELPALVQAVKDAGVEMTYFEFATAMALLYFARQRVDLAILEVGVGGAWDATNATDPILSIITSVELDHQEWLGDTLEEVAREKSGIMRNQMPVVVGPMGSVAKRVVLQESEVVGARVLLFGRDFYGSRDTTEKGMKFEGSSWTLNNLAPGLKGAFQVGNAACALAGLETLSTWGLEMTPEEAARGVQTARWPGRFQEIGCDPAIIVDAAHNPAGIRALIASLDARKKVVWIFSALSDKDLEGMAREMAGIGTHFVLVPLDHPRGRSVLDLEKGMPEGVDIRKVCDVRHGIEEARRLAGQEGCVVVAGSVFLAGEALRELGKMGMKCDV